MKRKSAGAAATPAAVTAGNKGGSNSQSAVPTGSKWMQAQLASALMLGMMFLAAIFALQGVLLSSLIEHYGLEDSAQGLASSAASAGGVIALVSSVFLIGRLPKVTLLQIALGVCAVFLALLKLAPTFAVFVGLWLALGVGMGYVDMLLSSCMADLYTGRRATQMMCILHMLYGVSSVICPPIYNGLMRGMAWNSVYLCVAAAGALLLAYTTLAARLMKRSGGSGLAEQKMNLKTAAKVITKGALPGLIAAMFCHGMFLGGLNTWINRYVGVTLNSSLGGMASSFMFFGVMASRLLMPILPLSPVKYVRAAGFAAGAAVLIALPMMNGWAMCIAVCLCGLAYGAMIPCMLDIGCAETPESTMLATTVMMLALYLAQAVVSPVIGALESAFSLHAGIGLCGAFMLLCSGFCLIARLPKEKK